MPTWKKIVVSGSQAELLSVTSSNGLLVSTNQQITNSPTTTFLSGSFSGSFRGDGTGITGISATNATSSSFAGTASLTAITNTTTGNPYFITFVASGSGNQPQLVNSSSLSYSATSNTITATASWATNALTANTASYVLNAVSASFASTASFLNTLNQTVNVTGAITASAGFSTPGNLFVGGNLQVAGVITGSATIITATNVAISDQFVILASGSTAPVDAGIIVQTAANSGEALYWEGNPTGVNRWALSSSLSATTVGPVTAGEYLVSAQIGASATPPTTPYYGGANSGSGNMYINNSNGDIFIYS